MNLERRREKGGSSNADRKANIAELEQEGRVCYEKIQSCKIAVDELMARIKPIYENRDVMRKTGEGGAEPGDAERDKLRQYAEVLGGAMTRFYEAGKEWVEIARKVRAARGENKTNG